MTGGHPMTSFGYELIVISACVLEESLLMGYRQNLLRRGGVLILGAVETVMSLLNISPFLQYVVRGVVLLAAVIFDRCKQKAKRTL